MKPLTILLLLLCSGALAQQNAHSKVSEYDERVSELERRQARVPLDSEVLESLASSYAMGGRYSDAIRVTRKLIALQPGNVAYCLRLANLYAWSGQLDQAIQEVHALGDRRSPDAIELECRLLTWKRDATGAAACYSQLQRAADAGSTQQGRAELGLARNLSWSGQGGQAIRAYREYTRSSPQDSAAILEYTRLLLIQGRYSEAERVISTYLVSHPGDAIALSLKAEILHWAGHRSHEAAALSSHAVALRPDLPEPRLAAAYALKDLGDVEGATKMFRELEDRVHAAGSDSQAPYAGGYEYLRTRVPEWGRMQVEVPFSEYNDTEGIHESSRGVRVTLPIGNDSVWFKGQQYAASAPVQSVFSFPGGAQNVSLFTAGATFNIGPDIHMESSAGLASFGYGSSQPVFSLGFSGSPIDRWNFQFGAARNIVPLTPRSIGTGLAFIGFNGGAEYYFNAQTSMGLNAERGLWNDGNTSVRSEWYLQRVLRTSRRLGIDAGPRARMESFARNMVASSGIFTPDLYQCYEIFIGLHGELGKRVVYEVRPALGAQRIVSGADFQASWEIASSLKLKVAQSLYLSANYQRRSYNLVSGSGSYQGFYLQLGLQP